MNYTLPQQAFDINNNSLFNTGCIDEINKVFGQQETFRLHVFQVMQHRFIVSLIIMSILIFYQLYFIKYIQPKYSQTEFYKKQIDYRIDLVIIILLSFNILYIFLM